MSEHNQNETVEESIDNEVEQTAAENAQADEATENSAPSEGSASLESLQKELEEARNQLAEQSDAMLRVRAEADNIRRRAERDVESAHKFALESFVESLLPVIDSLEQGLAHPTTSDESKALKEGMELTLKMFTDTLEKKQVVQLNPVGETFNPELHEAMSMQENADFEPNAVIAVFQKGYTLNGRLVRPARVVVNKAKPANIDEKV